MLDCDKRQVNEDKLVLGRHWVKEQGTIGPSQTKMKVPTALEPLMSETVRDQTGRRDQHD
jgi:hypothetical protein